MVSRQEEPRRDFGAVLGLRTSTTGAQREATQALGLRSKRPQKTSCTGTASREKAAPSGALAPNVILPHIFKVSIGANSDHFNSGGSWKNLKMPISTFDSNKKDAFLSYKTHVKVFVDGMALTEC